MRKPPIFSTVLTLFLLAYASITWAQITKTINGTVRYQSGISETQFTTPYGNVKIDLPQSLTGSVISGTVTTEPAGKNQKEKNRNLKDLLKMTLLLGDQKIPMTEIPFLFDWKPNPGTGQRTPIRLINFLGTEIGEVSLPPVIITPHIINPAEETNLTVSSNVMVKGDALSIYTNKQFTPGNNFVITDGKGQNFTVKPICQSANQAVLTVPAEASVGEISVRADKGMTVSENFGAETIRFNLIDINLTSPNTNLKPGEQSFVQVLCKILDISFGVENPTTIAAIDLRNLNPNTVTMQGGNFQRLYLDPSMANPTTGNFEITRAITGNAVGTFSVSATLHENYSTSNDPFRPQLNVLKTPENFNAWASALKKDLSQFASLDYDGGPTTQDYSAIKANIQRAINNMPVCTSPEQLDESKAVAYSLLQSVNVPKGAAISWLSSFESFKSMINSSATMTGQNDLPDWEIMQNGLIFIQRAGYKTNSPDMIREADNAGQLLDKCRETAPSATQWEQLKNSLQTLARATDQKIKADEGKNIAWNLSNLLYNTYCLDKRTRDGIDPQKSMIGYLDPENKIIKVKPEYQQQILNSLKAVPLGNNNYSITATNANRNPVNLQVQFKPTFNNPYEGDWWAEYLIKSRKSQDTIFGKVITSTKDSTGTWYIFYKDAKCNSSERWESSCSPYKEAEYVDGKRVEHETGYFEKYVSLPHGACYKGTDFCTEVYVIVGIKYIYMDANCTRLKTTINNFNFSCL